MTGVLPNFLFAPSASLLPLPPSRQSSSNKQQLENRILKLHIIHPLKFEFGKCLFNFAIDFI
jgi:hypothetical protein